MNCLIISASVCICLIALYLILSYIEYKKYVKVRKPEHRQHPEWTNWIATTFYQRRHCKSCGYTQEEEL